MTMIWRFFKNHKIPRFWWLTTVILAAWEDEIWRTAVPTQPGETVCETPSPK
jgi:hypothetical protein